jgi:hypothetical protein
MLDREGISQKAVERRRDGLRKEEDEKRENDGCSDFFSPPAAARLQDLPCLPPPLPQNAKQAHASHLQFAMRNTLCLQMSFNERLVNTCGPMHCVWTRTSEYPDCSQTRFFEN